MLGRRPTIERTRAIRKLTTMPARSEHKTAYLCVPARSLAGGSARRPVQVRILKYAQEIGWTYLPRTETEVRRGSDPDGATPEDRARTASLYFGDLLRTQVRAFNSKYGGWQTRKSDSDGG